MTCSGWPVNLARSSGSCKRESGGVAKPVTLASMLRGRSDGSGSQMNPLPKTRPLPWHPPGLRCRRGTCSYGMRASGVWFGRDFGEGCGASQGEKGSAVHCTGGHRPQLAGVTQRPPPLPVAHCLLLRLWHRKPFHPAHHDAAHRDEGRRAETKLLRAQERRDGRVTARADLAVGLGQRGRGCVGERRLKLR